MNKPKPKETSKKILLDELAELTAALAKSAHDIWVKQHMTEGWRYSLITNNKKRTYSNLKPYNKLSPSEQQQYRTKVVEFLKEIQPGQVLYVQLTRDRQAFCDPVPAG